MDAVASGEQVQQGDQGAAVADLPGDDQIEDAVELGSVSPISSALFWSLGQSSFLRNVALPGLTVRVVLEEFLGAA
ncbi:hypothetical protein GCM10010270_83200 [Streptomyces violaceus]|nr:hypothetical protein GCM10010270_83200 [Streptomyces janthinus]